MIHIQSLGKRLREFRKCRGLTQEELGERAGVCGKYIAEIERSEKNPTVTILQKIALALDVPMGEFFSPFDADEKSSGNLASINQILRMRDAETLNKINEILKIVFK